MTFRFLEAVNSRAHSNKKRLNATLFSRILIPFTGYAENEELLKVMSA